MRNGSASSSTAVTQAKRRIDLFAVNNPTKEIYCEDDKAADRLRSQQKQTKTRHTARQQLPSQQLDKKDSEWSTVSSKKRKGKTGKKRAKACKEKGILNLSSDEVRSTVLASIYRSKVDRNINAMCNLLCDSVVVGRMQHLLRRV